MPNTINTTKKSTKSKTTRQKFAIIILTISTTLKNFKKTTTSKESTTLKKSIKLKEIKIEDIQFILKKELVYFQDKKDEQLRLCISKAIKAKIFKLSYDAQTHEEFSRIYDKIIVNYYMRNLIRRLKRYLKHCLSY